MLVNKRLLQLTAGHRGKLSAVTALLCASTASYWLQAWFLAHALAGFPGLLQPAGNPDGATFGALLPHLLGVLACGLGRVVLQQVHARLASSLGSGVRLELRLSLAGKLLQAERLRDTSDRSGARRLALSEGVDGVDSYISNYIPHAIQLQVVVPVLLIGIAWINPLLAGVLLVAVAVAVGAPKLWSKALSKKGQQHWDSYEALSADFLEALQGMRTLRILRAIPQSRKRLDRRSQELHRATVSTMRTSLVDTALADFGIQAGMLAAAALAALSVLSPDTMPSPLGGTGAAVTYFLLMLSSEVFRPVRDLARQWHSGYLGLSALGSIDAAGGTADSLHDRHDGQEQPTAPTCSAPPVPPASNPGTGVVLPQSLALHDVSFRYDGTEQWILHNASATICRGSLTALAGPSGSGKSTLFDLLLGFLQADGGSITLDGRPLQAADVAVVSQHSYLFPGSIRENFGMVAPAAGDDRMLEVLAAVGLDRELGRHGLDTELAEAGSSVSGGQLQRLAIARALLVDRPVLLLDEPTSALNPDLASHVLAGLRDVACHRIVLMIAHRPDALAAADVVLRLQDRRLVPAQLPEAVSS